MKQKRQSVASEKALFTDRLYRPKVEPDKKKFKRNTKHKKPLVEGFLFL